MHDPSRILVIGAGFAGTHLVRALARLLPKEVAVTLVSDESYTTFNPMLPEAVGASVSPEQVIVPVREMLPRDGPQQFIMGAATALDRIKRELTCRTLAGDVVLGYDHLVLAVGNRARLDLLPGMAGQALPLKTVGDAMHIRNTVLRRLARIELESNAALRRSLGHFIVIGGGFAGAEVAGELVDCLRSIRRYYPRVAADELKVTVLQGHDRLLPELPPRLAAAALASLARRGVSVRLDTHAESMSAEGVRLAGGEIVIGQTVICTIGTISNPLLDRLGLPLHQGRVVVGGDMAVPDQPGLWAIGDCARVPNTFDGSFSPPTAQFAVRQAQALALNLRDTLAGKPLRPFRCRSHGMMASLGHRKGVAEVAGVRLTGLPAWLVWRGWYLMQIPTARRRLRIAVEWLLGMFYSPDITHLRFTRSHEMLADERRRQREHAQAVETQTGAATLR